METWESVLLSQLPLVVMAVFYLFELRRIRAAIESIEKKYDSTVSSKPGPL